MSIAFNSEIDVAVECAFGDLPYDTTPTWTEITDRVRRFRTFRGRGSVFDQIGPGELELELDNSNGDFDPTYSGGPYFGDLLPMVQTRVSAIYDSNTYRLWRGFVLGWPMGWAGDGGIMPISTPFGFDGLGVLGQVHSETAQSEETSGVRIGNLLDDGGWPASWRDIATGDVTVAAYQPPCQPVLQLIRQVEDTEAGLSFIAGDGDFTFQDQTHRTGLTSQATFGDDGTEIRWENAEMTLDDENIWNRVEVTRVGGATVASEDATSIGQYLERVLRFYDTLHVDDSAATAHAQTLRARYDTPYFRIQSLDFKPNRSRDDGAWEAALGLEVSDLVTVRRRPKQVGNLIELDVHIEGVQHEVDIIGEKTWLSSFALSGRGT